jgi:hypothetical protein
MLGSKLSVAEEKFIAAASPKNYTGAAMADAYVSLKNYQRLTIIIHTGAWAGGTAAVTLKQATAVAGTGVKALAFTKQFNDVAASGTLVETAVVANTFNLDTADKEYIIEVDAESLDLANGFDCVTAAIATPGANADLYSVEYVLSGARYQQSTPPSALVD